jgi:hypothetical protein
MEEIISRCSRAILDSLFKDDETTRSALNRLGNGSVPEDRILSLAASWKSGHCAVKVNREYIVHLMTQRADEFADEIFGMNWSLLRSTGGAAFITSDMPRVDAFD